MLVGWLEVPFHAKQGPLIFMCLTDKNYHWNVSSNNDMKTFENRKINNEHLKSDFQVVNAVIGTLTR